MAAKGYSLAGVSIALAGVSAALAGVSIALAGVSIALAGVSIAKAGVSALAGVWSKPVGTRPPARTRSQAEPWERGVRLHEQSPRLRGRKRSG